MLNLTDDVGDKSGVVVVGKGILGIDEGGGVDNYGENYRNYGYT